MIDSIFTPRFNVTPAINAAIQDIERQRWLVDNMLLMPRHEAQLRWLWRDVRIRRASGTTRIEGAGLDEAAVSKLIKRGPLGKYTEDEQENMNALEAYEFIDYLSDQHDIPIDELVIRQLNRYFIRTALETLTPGVYRRGRNTVGNFTPPDQGDVPALMRSFALWLREEDETHPVLKAALAHIHLVAIHPFWDGNGRTARGLSTLIFQRSPLGLRKLLSLESYMFGIRDNYLGAIERTLGTNFSLEYDATPWLEFFTLSSKVHVEGLVGMLTDWHRMMQNIHEVAEKKGWTQRQIESYAFAAQRGQITRSDHMAITGVSPATASRDLAELVAAGMLIPDGNTRSRIYRPVPIVPLKLEPEKTPDPRQLRMLSEA